MKAEIDIKVAHDMIAATCTEEGKCQIQGCTYTEEAKGHSYTNYISNNDAKCEEDGTETAQCDRCEEKHTRTDEGSKKSHNYENGKCTECGKTIIAITSEKYNISGEFITKIENKKTMKETL